MKLLGALVLAVLAGSVVATVSGAGSGKAGCPSAAPMLTGVGGSTVTPIISVGESLGGRLRVRGTAGWDLAGER